MNTKESQCKQWSIMHLLFGTFSNFSTKLFDRNPLENQSRDEIGISQHSILLARVEAKSRETIPISQHDECECVAEQKCNLHMKNASYSTLNCKHNASSFMLHVDWSNSYMAWTCIINECRCSAPTHEPRANDSYSHFQFREAFNNNLKRVEKCVIKSTFYVSHRVE